MGGCMHAWMHNSQGNQLHWLVLRLDLWMGACLHTWTNDSLGDQLTCYPTPGTVAEMARRATGYISICGHMCTTL